MPDANALLVFKLREVIINMINSLNGYIDENFYSQETIAENLIIKEISVEGETKLTARLEEDYEYNLFNNLLYDIHLRKFYHYTSFENLFKIIDCGKLHLNSLIGLNDKSEVDFVNNFMGKGFANPHHPVPVAYHNTHFIFCLSENVDQLNQWRLYGDDAAGAMLEFDIDHQMFSDKSMKISKITYDLKLFEIIKDWLAYCRDDLNISFGFYQIDYWKFFYKNKDYQDEKEVRLLLKNSLNENKPSFIPEKYKLNRYGIIVPYVEINCLGSDSDLIRLKNIMLGPKCDEADIKVAQIRYMLSRRYPGFEIHVCKSRIDHYR